MPTHLHLRTESGELVGSFAVHGTVLIEQDQEKFTIYGVEPDGPGDGWSRSKYVWGDYRGGRAIYVRIAGEDKTPRWYRAGTGRSITKTDMARLNPTAVDKEN